MISHLTNLERLCEMLSRLSGDSFAAIGNLGQVSHMLHDAPNDARGLVGIQARTLETGILSLDEVCRIAQELDLDATKAAALECTEIVNRHHVDANGIGWFKKVDTDRLSWMLHNLRTNLAAQLQSRLVLVIASPNTKFVITDEPPFGSDVDDAFPKAAEEISEAAKCLAFERNTACVFHLMRAMECAVARLSQVLKTGKETNKELGKILSDIGAAIETMPKGAERDQWSESHAHLYHVKQAWRNATMHPKTTYTDNQAQAVFVAVRSFMAHLAPLVQ